MPSHNLLTFGNFMQQWLYGHTGYYHKAHVGKNRDFYTNVSVGKFFGYTLGFYLRTILHSLNPKGRVALVEIGSEKGDLIADVAEFFQCFNDTLEYATLEPLASLQNLQQKTFAQRLRKDKKRLKI